MRDRFCLRGDVKGWVCVHQLLATIMKTWKEQWERRLTVSEMRSRMRWSHSVGPEVRSNVRAVELSGHEAEGE